MSTDAQEILISPIELKRLGKTSPALTTIEKFGGAKNSNPATTENLELLQDNFDNGYSPNLEETTINIKNESGDVIGTAVVNLPRGREQGGLFFTLSSGLRMLQQNPLDYVQNQTYTTNAIVKKYQTRDIYQSVVNNNTGADFSASAYSNATSYDINVFVKNTNGDIYKSLASSNLNNPLSDNTKWQLVWRYIIDYLNWQKITTYLTTFNGGNELIQADGTGKVPVANSINPYFIGDYKDSVNNNTSLTNGFGTFLLCNGQAVSRTIYASLFAVVGTAFGPGDGTTTFRLPDFRGRVVGMIGQGSGLTNRTLGQVVGAETHTLTINEIPSHNHGVVAVAGLDVVLTPRDYPSGSSPLTSKTQNTGGGESHNNMQPTLFACNRFIYAG